MNKGITQESLAQSLGVTYQAVSRWENGITTPDISLLPLIAVYFGISIDSLFEFSNQSQLERINNMLFEENLLSEEDFNSAKDYLEKRLRDTPKDTEILTAAAMLYERRGKDDLHIASNYAKESQSLRPCGKDVNNVIRDAANGVHRDWNYNNHHGLIDYYYEYIKRHPREMLGYHYLLDHLIADGRLAEAKEVLSQIRDADEAERIGYYECEILKKEGKFAEAEEAHKKLLSEHPENWYVYAIYADFLASRCRYDDAVKMYEKTFTLQPQPRYSDALESIAIIYEIQKDYDSAIQKTEEILKLLESDWKLTFGITVNKYKQKMEDLKIKRDYGNT